METIVISRTGKRLALIFTILLIWLGWPLGGYMTARLPLSTVPADTQWLFIVHAFLVFGWGAMVAIGLTLATNGSLRPLSLTRLNLKGYSVLGIAGIIPTVTILCGLLAPPLRGEGFMSGAVVGATIGMCASFLMILFCLLAEIEDLD